MAYQISKDIKCLNYREHSKILNHTTNLIYDKKYGNEIELPFSVAVGGGISCIVHEATWDKDIQVSFFVNKKVISDRKFMYGELELKKFILSISKNEFYYMKDLF